MAAEVSSQIRVLASYKEEDNRTAVGSGQKSTALVTRDLLGQSSNLAADSQELDLDLQVPSGWEKRLDLKSGKIYIQRSQTPDSPLNSDSESKFEDLNFPQSPNSSRRTLNLFNETSLDLKSPPPSLANYGSVCTLDKVKSALERADKEELIRKRSPSSSSAPPALAVGCPGCYSYVMVMKNNPFCPRCNSVVPLPTIKKPRIDLNMSI